jgi:apolipoprotein N-acyltransferase
MEESPYVVFLGFAFVWVLLGVSGLFWLMRSEGQQMKMPPAALIVILPILIAFAVALTFGALSM